VSVAEPLALAQLMIAARAREFGGLWGRANHGFDEASAARRMRAWGRWLDASIAAGFGAAEVMASAPRATFALTVWGDSAEVDELIELSGASELERTRFASIAAQAEATGAWLFEDDDGFEGGFVLTQVTALRMRAMLPGAGVSRLVALAEELGLGTATELRRTVNPGAEATEVVFAGASADVVRRAWRSLLGQGPPQQIEALMARAQSLVLKAGERGLTAIGVRLPLTSVTDLVAGLSAVGAAPRDDERLAATLGALDVALPQELDLVARAGGHELRAWVRG
jgi:hypothetical protein